jgi:CDP-diacylglycerol--glycerol-3-phosphate 3-phosphatidyltransferase
MDAVANALSGFRVVLSLVIVGLALVGSSRLAGMALIVAGTTDFFDGYLAKRARKQSADGARLDSSADVLLLVASAAALQILHPTILGDNTVLLAATAAV